VTAEAEGWDGCSSGEGWDGKTDGMWQDDGFERRRKKFFLKKKKRKNEREGISVMLVVVIVGVGWGHVVGMMAAAVCGGVVWDGVGGGLGN